MEPCVQLLFQLEWQILVRFHLKLMLLSQQRHQLQQTMQAPLQLSQLAISRICKLNILTLSPAALIRLDLSIYWS
jgi:hypothetical protein